MTIAIIDSENDCSFAIKFANEAVVEKVKKYMKEGLEAWFCAAHTPINYNGSLFTKEEVEGYYWSGFAEPTSDLLYKENIEHDVIDIEWDEDGHVINADETIYY